MTARPDDYMFFINTIRKHRWGRNNADSNSDSNDGDHDRSEPFTPPVPNPEELAQWIAEMKEAGNDDEWIESEMTPAYGIHANRRGSPYTLYSVGADGRDDTARWTLPENRVFGRRPADWILDTDDQRL